MKPKQLSNPKTNHNWRRSRRKVRVMGEVKIRIPVPEAVEAARTRRIRTGAAASLKPSPEDRSIAPSLTASLISFATAIIDTGPTLGFV